MSLLYHKRWLYYIQNVASISQNVVFQPESGFPKLECGFLIKKMNSVHPKVASLTQKVASLSQKVAFSLSQLQDQLVCQQYAYLLDVVKSHQDTLNEVLFFPRLCRERAIEYLAFMGRIYNAKRPIIKV